MHDQRRRESARRLPNRLAQLQQGIDALMQVSAKLAEGDQPTNAEQVLAMAFETLAKALAVLDAAVQKQCGVVAAAKHMNDIIEHSAPARDRMDRIVTRLLYQSLIGSHGDEGRIST